MASRLSRNRRRVPAAERLEGTGNPNVKRTVPERVYLHAYDSVAQARTSVMQYLLSHESNT